MNVIVAATTVRLIRRVREGPWENVGGDPNLPKNAEYQAGETEQELNDRLAASMSGASAGVSRPTGLAAC